MTPGGSAADAPALGKRLRAAEEVAGESHGEVRVAGVAGAGAVCVNAAAGRSSASPAAGVALGGDDPPDALLHSRDHYRVRKRVPLRAESARTDVYVTRGARFRGLVARCVALLDARRAPTLHALGAAIGRAVDVALAVQAAARGAVALAPRTATVVVFDDYEPLVPGLPRVTKERSKSAIHITIKPTEDYV